MDLTVNETVLKTPQPRAWSTETKDRKLKLPEKKVYKELRFNSDTASTSDTDDLESLGLLSIASSDCSALLDSKKEVRQKSKAPVRSVKYDAKVAAIREKVNKYLNSVNESDKNDSSGYVNTPLAESTVNETDLLGNTEAASACRSSLSQLSRLSEVSKLIKTRELNDTPAIRRQNSTNATDTEKRRESDILSDLSSKFRSHANNIEMSLKDIIGEIPDGSSLHIDSGMFMPAELAVEKLEADELSWRRERDLPTIQDPNTTFSQASSFDEKVSIGNFFKEKSDSCSTIFRKLSPSKSNPFALYEYSSDDCDKTATSVPDQSSILSLTQIKNMITDDDTPTKLVDKLLDSKKRNEKILKQNNFFNTGTISDLKTSMLSSRKMSFSNNDLQISNFLSPAISMNSLVLNKENTPQNMMDKSLTSIRSASSMDSFPEGKPPIVSTKEELVWGCVKIGKSVVETVTIKNRYQSRVRFQMTISNPNYKISSTDSDLLQAVTVLLHPLESRQFSVTFTPTSTGAHVGKLQFSPFIKGELQATNQALCMYGYGGHASIQLRGITKDTIGKHWLSMGICAEERVSKSITIKNYGTLPGFAYFSAHSFGLCSVKSIRLTPSEVVLKPGQQANIVISFKPTANEYKKMTDYFLSRKQVYEITQLKMITGAEVMRGRLRRLYRKAMQQNLPSEEITPKISETFHGEYMPDDLKLFRERNVNCIQEFVNHDIETHDISVTCEPDPDKTIVASMGLDETSVYHTIYNQPDVTMAESDSSIPAISCTIDPQYLILTPPLKTVDTFLLTSEIQTPMQFEIKLEPEGIISVKPHVGVIMPGKIMMIKVACAKEQIKDRQHVKMLVFTDKDFLEADIKIIYNIKQ